MHRLISGFRWPVLAAHRLKYEEHVLNKGIAKHNVDCAS